ncbi:bifunctional Protein kinase-like domain superfamily/Serine-threonine-protein kinase [Babesia duncani]|uniref:Cyclin-dependent kinase 2 homolog n=1 Tax=Babesia duncani TaxID=323732 RepID=A0AAD9PMF9_9APIC|nr:bifunctional Protein kinase-like domain superfamily/Serine-threonine-protein kinase [Babesia duncani]
MNGLDSMEFYSLIYKRNGENTTLEASKRDFRLWLIETRHRHIEKVLGDIQALVDAFVDGLTEKQCKSVSQVFCEIPATPQEFLLFCEPLLDAREVHGSIPWLISQLSNISNTKESREIIEKIREKYKLLLEIHNATHVEEYIPFAKEDDVLWNEIVAYSEKLNLNLPRIRLQNFVKIHQVGQGAYGDVWLAEDIVNKSAVALKKLKLNDEREGFPKNAIREIYLLNSLKHRNIVNLLGIANSCPQGDAKENVWMVFEYLPFDLGGYTEALRDPNEKRDKLTKPLIWLSIGEIKSIMQQLLEAVAFCHHRNILHRDLKTANLLMTNDGTIKLADFGLARICPNGQGTLTNRVVTLWYRPPELLLGSETYDAAVDMWSVGCIMAELASGTHMFAADKEPLILKLIAERMGLPTEADMKVLTNLPLWNEKLANPIHPTNQAMIITRKSEVEKIFKTTNELGQDGWDLLKSFFAWTPACRITASEALKHRWFSTDPKPTPLIDRQNVKVAHSFMTKNQRKRDLQRNYTKHTEYTKYANTGSIRRTLEQHIQNAQELQAQSIQTDLPN